MKEQDWASLPALETTEAAIKYAEEKLEELERLSDVTKQLSEEFNIKHKENLNKKPANSVLEIDTVISRLFNVDAAETLKEMEIAKSSIKSIVSRLSSIKYLTQDNCYYASLYDAYNGTLTFSAWVKNILTHVYLTKENQANYEEFCKTSPIKVPVKDWLYSKIVYNKDEEDEEKDYNYYNNLYNRYLLGNFSSDEYYKERYKEANNGAAMSYADLNTWIDNNKEELYPDFIKHLRANSITFVQFMMGNFRDVDMKVLLAHLPKSDILAILTQ